MCKWRCVSLLIDSDWYVELQLWLITTYNYIVSQKKLHPFYCCDIFVRFHPILLIFGRNIPQEIWNKYMYTAQFQGCRGYEISHPYPYLYPVTTGFQLRELEVSVTFQYSYFTTRSELDVILHSNFMSSFPLIWQLEEFWKSVKIRWSCKGMIVRDYFLRHSFIIHIRLLKKQKWQNASAQVIAIQDEYKNSKNS